MDIVSKLLLDFDPAMIVIIYLMYHQFKTKIIQLEEKVKKLEEREK